LRHDGRGSTLKHQFDQQITQIYGGLSTFCAHPMGEVNEWCNRLNNLR